MGLLDFFKRKPMENSGSINELIRKEADEKIRIAQKQQASTSVASKDFVMIIEDVFTITGRGTIVTGLIESGVVRLNDTVKIEFSPGTTEIKENVSDFVPLLFVLFIIFSITFDVSEQVY